MKEIPDSVTLADHVKRIGSLGGQARAKSMTAKQRTAAARHAGLAGGEARAQSLTPEQRKEIAQKAARKRWEK